MVSCGTPLARVVYGATAPLNKPRGAHRAVAGRQATQGDKGTTVSGSTGLRSLLEKGSLTRLMVLRALARGHAHTLRRIADELGVSVQAVSEHLKRLTQDGLVETGDEGPQLTREGHEALASSLGLLKDYVDNAVRDLARIETTAARAGEALREGTHVGLFMQDGELVARSDSTSPSRGRALQDAEPGQDVLVGELEGIVELEPGRVTFATVPDIEQGGSRGVDLDEAGRLLSPPGLVVAMGPVARRVAEQAGREPVRYGGPSVAAEAALVGVDVVVLVESRHLEDAKRRYQKACAEWGMEATSGLVRIKGGE